MIRNPLKNDIFSTVLMNRKNRYPMAETYKNIKRNIEKYLLNLDIYFLEIK